MNFYVFLCHIFVFTILIEQYLCSKQHQSDADQAAAVGSWFSSLERRLNDVMHDVFQRARATAADRVTEPTKVNEDLVGNDIDESNPNEPLQLTEFLGENLLENEVYDETTKIEVTGFYLEAGSTPPTKPARKKKLRKNKKKNRNLKPKRLKQSKNKKSTKTEKKHPKRKYMESDPKHKIKASTDMNEVTISSEHTHKGKPVDIIVHIKMNE